MTHMFRMNKWGTQGMQLLFFVAVYFVVESSASWYWWAAAFVMHCVYAVVGNNIALHKYFAHKMMSVSKPVEWLFVWTGSMIGVGDPVGYTLIHTSHHKHSDTNADPHGRASCGVKSVLVGFHKNIDPQSFTPTRRIVELSKQYGWLHNYYWLFVFGNATVLYLISYEVFLFGWFLPATFTTWCAAIAVLAQHWNNEPNNGMLSRLLVTYDSLHKNHHDWPQAPNCALQSGQVDFAYQISRLFLPTYNWSGQPPKAKNNEQPE